MTKQFYPDLRSRNAKHVLKLGRNALSKFINLVTGHNELAYHRSLCDENDNIDNCCSFCNTDRETFFHFITECPALWRQRNDTFLDKPPDTGQPWEVQALIRFSNIDKINDLLEWIPENANTSENS